MFNKFLKFNMGRTNIKVISAMLAFILVFANFSILGSFVYQSLALDNMQNAKTNIENVKFEAYLNTNEREITAELNSKEQKLNVVVQVQNEGKLENAILNFENSNFKTENNSQKYNIGTIESGDKKEIEIPIVACKSKSFNLELLNMTSFIKLSGEYIDNNGNSKELETEKQVKIKWTANQISNDDINLEQELITNKIYNIDGENKRVLQLAIKTNLLQNVAPVSQEQIEVKIPKIEAELEDVKVVAKSTMATNGKAHMEYELKDEKILINVLNNPNEEQNISWQEDAQDELIVTYVYKEEVELTPFISDVKTIVNIYGKEEPIQKEDAIQINDYELVTGSVIDLESKLEEDIYKGYMYVNQETNYETTKELFISYMPAVGELELIDTAGVIENENVKNYITKIKINKEDLVNLLGPDGNIKIYDESNLENELQTINLSEENEQEYYTVEFTSNVSEILIKTTKPVNEGKLEITSSKQIIVLNDYKVEENEMSTLFTLENSNEETDNKEITGVVELKEPQTSIDVSINKESISSQLENTLRITTLLKAFDASEKLYKNPTISIQLPSEIKEAQIENISLIDEELQIESTEIITSVEGNKVLVITLQGEQTKYNKNSALRGANIVVDLKVKTDNFMADKKTQIDVTVENEEENLNRVLDMQIISKKGINTKAQIKVGENTVEQVNNEEITTVANIDNETALISASLINNFDESIKDVTLIGTLKTNLTKEITTNEMLEVYYLDEQNNWVKDVEDYSKAKQFKIKLNNEMEKADQIDLWCEAELTEDISGEENFVTLTLNYNLNEQLLSKTLNYRVDLQTILKQKAEIAKSEKTYSANLSMTQKTAIKELYNGQRVTYVVSAKNTGDTVINNAKLQYVIPDGAVYTQIKYAQGEDIEFEDDINKNVQEWDIEKLEPGESFEREVTIKINNDVTKIVNVAKLLNENNEEEIELKSKEIPVKEGNLEVILSRRDNLSITLDEESSIMYIVIVKNNTQNKMNNITIKGNIPENTQYEKNSEFNKDWSYNEQDNALYYNISELNAEETKVLSFVVKTNNFKQEVKQASIDNTVIASTQNNDKYESNVITSIIKPVRWDVNQIAEHTKELKVGDTVKYIITVKNVGLVGKAVNVLDQIPEDIHIKNVQLYINNEQVEDNIINANRIDCLEILEPQEELKIEVEGIVYDSFVGQKEITNVVQIPIANNEYLESNKITNIITNNNKVTPEEPQNPVNPVNPQQPQNPNEPTQNDNNTTYSISGLAWIDKNTDGIRNNDEKILKDVNVILLDSQGNIAKDHDGNNIETKTTINGTYKFNNLNNGEYLVAFVYDTNKYSITKYKATEANENTNSDAIEKTITIDNKEEKIALTDVIKLNDSKVDNIDLGLVEKGRFDLRLDKYITEVNVTNNKKEVEKYSFEDATNFTKVEISAKRFAGSTVVIEYNLRVTNEGDIDGYVGDIIDYLPKELSFNSELNPDWYLGSDKNLHYTQVDLNKIEPGKVQNVKLVLTKTLNNDSVGTVTNEAEIGESSNLSGIKESDSIVKNKKAGEDDISKADLIISIKTGSIKMYIEIVLGSLAIIGLGIFLINEKLLKGGKK